MQINCRGVRSDKTELTNTPDDVVVVSDPHCVTLAVTWLMRTWRCDRDTCHRVCPQGDAASLPTQTADRLLKKEKKKQEHKNLWATSAVWWQAASQDQRVSFKNLCLHDSHWHLQHMSSEMTFLFMTDTYSLGNTTTLQYMQSRI